MNRSHSPRTELTQQAINPSCNQHEVCLDDKVLDTSLKREAQLIARREAAAAKAEAEGGAEPAAEEEVAEEAPIDEDDPEAVAKRQVCVILPACLI